MTSSEFFAKPTKFHTSVQRFPVYPCWVENESEAQRAYHMAKLPPSLEIKKWISKKWQNPTFYGTINLEL
jgi:hypothetical protein